MKYALTKAASQLQTRIRTVVSQAWTTVQNGTATVRAAVPTVRIEIGHIDLRWESAALLIVSVAFILLSPSAALSGKMPENPSDLALITAPIRALNNAEPRLPVIEEFPKPKVVKTMRVSATAYNSLPGQTDGDPFTTASGSRTHKGTVAGCFPFGTKLEIIDPKTGQSLDGIIYTVEDRTAKNTCNHIDIWMETLPQAKQWGRRNVEIRIVEPVDYSTVK